MVKRAKTWDPIDRRPTSVSLAHELSRLLCKVILMGSLEFCCSELRSFSRRALLSYLGTCKSGVSRVGWKWQTLARPGKAVYFSTRVSMCTWTVPVRDIKVCCTVRFKLNLNRLRKILKRASIILKWQKCPFHCTVHRHTQEYVKLKTQFASHVYV